MIKRLMLLLAIISLLLLHSCSGKIIPFELPEYSPGDVENFIVRNRSGRDLYIVIYEPGNSKETENSNDSKNDIYINNNKKNNDAVNYSELYKGYYSLGLVITNNGKNSDNDRKFKINCDDIIGGDIKKLYASLSNSPFEIVTNWTTPIYNNDEDIVMWEIKPEDIKGKPYDVKTEAEIIATKYGKLIFKYYPDYNENETPFNVTLWNGGANANVGGEEIITISPNKAFYINYPFNKRIFFWAHYWHDRNGYVIKKTYRLPFQERILTMDEPEISISIPREEEVPIKLTGEDGTALSESWVKITNKNENKRLIIAKIKKDSENKYKYISNVSYAGNNSYVIKYNESNEYRIEEGVYSFLIEDINSEIIDKKEDVRIDGYRKDNPYNIIIEKFSMGEESIYD